MTKKSRGRQKIAMEKMANEGNLQVTFSKRRTGLFKKASELSTLCGAKLGLIVFSPGRKVYSYGNPNVQTLIDEHLNNHHLNPHQYNNNDDNNIDDVRGKADRIVRLNNQLTQLANESEKETKKTEELKKQRRDSDKAQQQWMRDRVAGFELNQTDGFKDNLNNLKNKIKQQAEIIYSSQYYVGNSSHDDLYGINSGNNNMNFDYGFYNPNTMMHSNGYVPGSYGLNYGQNQNQNQSVRREDTSEYEPRHDVYFNPNFRFDYE